VQRADVPYDPALGCGDQDQLVLAGDRGHHLRDAGVVGPGNPVDLVQQVDLDVEGHVRGRNLDGVEVSCGHACVPHGHGVRPTCVGRNVARLLCSQLQILHRDLIRVSESRLLFGRGADADPLADVAGRLLDNPFLESDFFVHSVLEVEVCVVYPFPQGRTQRLLQGVLGQPELLQEKFLRSLDRFGHDWGYTTQWMVRIFLVM
jgi:hypothetical protein